MYEVVSIVHILVCVALIGLVLIQQGKGAEAGAAFGSGASATIFGSRGSASFLTRITAILATLFFLTSLTLSYFLGKHIENKSVIEKVQSPIEKVQVPPTKTTDLPTPPTSSPKANDLPPKPETHEQLSPPLPKPEESGQLPSPPPKPEK